jgi:hypothetical protein
MNCHDTAPKKCTTLCTRCVMCNIFYCHILDVSQQEMSKFVEMHEHVMDVIDGINKSFADTISIILLSCYLHLVVCPYILFVVANNNDGCFLNMVYFLWNFVHISRLLVITEVCHNCEDEVAFLESV